MLIGDRPHNDDAAPAGPGWPTIAHATPATRRARRHSPRTRRPRRVLLIGDGPCDAGDATRSPAIASHATTTPRPRRPPTRRRRRDALVGNRPHATTTPRPGRPPTRRVRRARLVGARRCLPRTRRRCRQSGARDDHAAIHASADAHATTALRLVRRRSPRDAGATTHSSGDRLARDNRAVTGHRRLHTRRPRRDCIRGLACPHFGLCVRDADFMSAVLSVRVTTRRHDCVSEVRTLLRAVRSSWLWPCHRSLIHCSLEVVVRNSDTS
jgi:hypothetical protein